MAEIIYIDSLDHEGLEVYWRLTEAQLRSRLDTEKAVFIAESPKVIDVALRAGYTPLSMLCEERHITGDASSIIERCGDIPVFTGRRELLQSLTGYTLTRGVLCAMRRPQAPALADIVSDAKRVTVIDSVTDTTNIGAIFRSAAALGIDAVCLTRTSCDPFNRRAVRVSMGSVFLIPWTWIDSPADLRSFGFRTVAMALSDDSVSIDDPILTQQSRLAIILGA
ncbi:MAG: RNA methyltransferase, partial [Muribaculaceae bacterium]|nr:RNA methyltransferase [Muribaculaceae bacterium]